MELMTEIRSRIGVLYSVTEAIASLDLIVCLTHVASIKGWIKPDFGNCLAIRDGKHPIMNLVSENETIPNNTVSLHLIFFSHLSNFPKM